MGGSVRGRGNLPRLPVEFNFGFDPEAAHIVLTHWPCVELVDWQATLDHGLPFGEMESWLEADNPRARFYAAISRKARTWMKAARGAEHWHIADALAMAVVLAPEAVLERQQRHVQIELDGSTSRGMSIVDWDRRGGQADNASIMQRFDLDRFGALLQLALGAKGRKAHG
jgi:purine nucleosidase